MNIWKQLALIALIALVVVGIERFIHPAQTCLRAPPFFLRGTLADCEAR